MFTVAWFQLMGRVTALFLDKWSSLISRLLVLCSLFSVCERPVPALLDWASGSDMFWVHLAFYAAVLCSGHLHHKPSVGPLMKLFWQKEEDINSLETHFQ